jgi:hypothetical protein
VTKVRIHLRAAAGDVESNTGIAPQSFSDMVDNPKPHNLTPGRRGIDVTMSAMHVAQVAEVYLQRLQLFKPGTVGVDGPEALLNCTNHLRRSFSLEIT